MTSARAASRRQEPHRHYPQEAAGGDPTIRKMRGLGSPMAQIPTPAPPPAVRNGSNGRERVRPPFDDIFSVCEFEYETRVRSSRLGLSSPDKP